MRGYTQLTQEQRYQIYILKQAGYNQAQIAEMLERDKSTLKEHEAGRSMVDLAREHGIAQTTLYRWKSKFGGMEVSDAKKLRELEAENAKLKQLCMPMPCSTTRALRNCCQKSGEARPATFSRCTPDAAAGL